MDRSCTGPEKREMGLAPRPSYGEGAPKVPGQNWANFGGLGNDMSHLPHLVPNLARGPARKQQMHEVGNYWPWIAFLIQNILSMLSFLKEKQGQNFCVKKTGWMTMLVEKYYPNSRGFSPAGQEAFILTFKFGH